MCIPIDAYVITHTHKKLGLIYSRISIIVTILTEKDSALLENFGITVNITITNVKYK